MIPDREMGVFEQLKPIYGSQIDRLWKIYLASKPWKKEKMLRALQLHAAEIQHKAIGNRKIYIEPPPADVIARGDYEMGSVIFPGKAPYPFRIKRDELLRHALFDGPSGSGKTTLIMNLMEQVQEDGIPWLALDWKGSFRVLMHAPRGEHVIVLTTGSDVAPLRINMLLPPPRVGRTAWLENVADTICAAYSLLDGARSKLLDVFVRAIDQYGKNATLRDAYEVLKADFGKVEAWRKRGQGWMESTERSFRELTRPPFGDCLNEQEHPMQVEELLKQPVAVELRGLGEAQGTTISIFFLQATLLIRQHQEGPREVLRNILLLDESQNVFRPQPHWERPNLPNRLISEVREYGTACLCGTQGVGVSEQLLTNTATQVIMRTRGKWELDYFSKSLQVNPQDLATIPIGQAIGIVPRHGWHKPFLFKFPENKLKNTIVTDDEVQARYLSWRTQPTTSTYAPGRVRIGEKELALLRDIATHPTKTTTQHYENLGWNPKIGSTIKNRLVQAGIINVEVVDDGRYRRKFLKLNPGAMSVINEQGISATSPKNPGIDHEHWRENIKHTCEEHGYTVTTEYDLGNHRYVDLRATRGDTVLLIEVETGKSNVAANCQKVGSQGTLIVFFTNNHAYEKHQSLIPDHIITLTPDTIHHLNGILH